MAIQVVVEGHDIARGEGICEPVGSGRVATVQVVPERVSATGVVVVPATAVPATAIHAVAEEHEIATGEAVDELVGTGRVATVHVVPERVSANGA